MRLAFLTPARVNIIYISTDRCQKPQSLAPQGFQEFIFDTPIYSMTTHNYTIYRLSISLHTPITQHFLFWLWSATRHTYFPTLHLILTNDVCNCKWHRG